MYGIFTYIYPKNHPNVGKYTIQSIWVLDLEIFRKIAPSTTLRTASRREPFYRSISPSGRDIGSIAAGRGTKLNRSSCWSTSQTLVLYVQNVKEFLRIWDFGPQIPGFFLNVFTMFTESLPWRSMESLNVQPPKLLLGGFFGRSFLVAWCHSTLKIHESDIRHPQLDDLSSFSCGK